MKDLILILLLKGEKPCGELREILLNTSLNKALTYDSVKKASERAVRKKLLSPKVKKGKVYYRLTAKGKKMAQQLFDYYDRILDIVID